MTAGARRTGTAEVTAEAGSVVGSVAGSAAPSVDVGRSARASMVVATFTSLSRLTGVVRVLAVGAVLGPTQVGDVYQVTNTLPNLIWYGFLAGSLVPALLVPVLVERMHRRLRDEEAGVGRVSCGFLGLAAIGAGLLAPLCVVALPLLMRVANLGTPAPLSDDEADLARVMVLLTVPQVFLYAVIGTAGAVMYAHRRFALPSAGPALENLGVVVVLLVVAGTYGGARGMDGQVPLGELVLLGGGSTGAVMLNAALQWWGARRCGIVLRPTRGWREPEVRSVVGQASRSVLSAALLAAQTLLILLLASRVTGGAVALQVAFNFYVLPVALIGTAIGLALLPELSRFAQSGHWPHFDETLTRGLSAALFLAAPAAVGYVVLAGPVAELVAVGQLDTPAARSMIAGSLGALSLGLIGQVVCFVATQACYSRQDTRAPLWCMVAQAVACLVLCSGAATWWDGPELVRAVALAYAVASLLGGLLLLIVLIRSSGGAVRRFGPAAARIGAGVLAMAVPVRLVSDALDGTVAGHGGAALTVGAASLTGLVAFVVTQHLLRSPELVWWRSGVRRPQETRGVVR